MVWVLPVTRLCNNTEIWHHRKAYTGKWVTEIRYGTLLAYAKAYNTCIVPQATYCSCSGAVHVTYSGRTAFRPRMGKVGPTGRMRPSDSFCAARRQQQKRFSVGPFEKLWETWIFQISFVWLRILNWYVSYEQVSTATVHVSTTFNTLPIES